MPSFYDARYVMPEADYRSFARDGDGATDAIRIVFSDSIVPVADQTRLRADAGRPAVFVGDLTHCPT